MDIYIHYGHKSFNKELFNPIVNREFLTKPYGGFWATNINSEYGWKEWCETNKFQECSKDNSFIFTLTDDARILKINSSDDLNNLPKRKNDFGILTWIIIDFEKLSELYDAIEVNISADYDLYYKLYGWDCDSILIMNPNIIKIV